MELTWYGLSIKEVITHSVHLHAMNVKNGWYYQTGAVAHRLANTGITTLDLSSPCRGDHDHRLIDHNRS